MDTFLIDTVFPACVPSSHPLLPQILHVQALSSALGCAVAKTATKACPQGAAGQQQGAGRETVGLKCEL